MIARQFASEDTESSTVVIWINVMMAECVFLEHNLSGTHSLHYMHS